MATKFGRNIISQLVGLSGGVCAFQQKVTCIRQGNSKYTFIGPDGRKYKRTSLERGDGSNIPVACFHNGSLGIFGEHILDTVVL
ncbi:hypothetical protein SERLA73DRAFT_130296, partial [Serpula lacrymans var. lacrymans S7.3]